MKPKALYQHIRSLIAAGKLDQALKLLQSYLANSPQLDEILHQSGRFAMVRKQIRQGHISDEDATVTTNQIQYGILELITEMEKESERPELQEELQQAVTIIQKAEKIYNIGHIDQANFS